MNISSQTFEKYKLVMGSGTRKPKTRGKNPTFLLPDPNPKTDTRTKPETRHSKPENPRFFQVSQFPSKSPNFYSRSAKKNPNFSLKNYTKLFFLNYTLKRNIFHFRIFFKKYIPIFLNFEKH